MKRENPEEQDSAWQKIVENYGERAELDAVDDRADEGVVEPPLDPDLRDEDPVRSGLFDDDALDEIDRFVPDSPPPVPMPPPDRFLAWLGVFGSPTVLLVFLVLGLGMPQILGWILVGGFVLGFCYLVFTLPRSPRDPWDDGAVV